MQGKDIIIISDGKIIKYKVIKKVVKNGHGGGINIPKDLIGKTVCVEFVTKEVKK
jgi:putative transposon-encoded protein